MSLGHSPNVESYRPDMKKAESEITSQEKEEARRRIEGANAPDVGRSFGVDIDEHAVDDGEHHDVAKPDRVLRA